YLTPEGLVRTLAVRYDYRLRGEAVAEPRRWKHRRPQAEERNEPREASVSGLSAGVCALFDGFC
ncbi:hypothetical protein BRD06_05910, partial [Halobacteriales archaeon QS_9_67_15]